MTFGAPEWLWALLTLPALIGLFFHAEHRRAIKLREFVAPRLLAQLGATVSPFRRGLRFALLLAVVALALVSLAKPRWGYTYEDVKRKGLDLIVAVDTSRSMLANDVQPNRLERVKLAAQDLLNELRGDRIGLIAFAGRAFLQAPLTIDYDAAVESLTELDTNIIPEGGTNISEAINLAVKTYGKSAVGNRALIIFTDGEELAGDAVKVAKAAADAGVRIFTIGVGTPEGSLIPLTQAGGTSFVKDSSGQVVKSKLDEKRLREIAEATGGIFVRLENGPATMQQLYRDGIGKMQAEQIDARTARRPIERYQWPLAAALLALAASHLINERKSARRRPLVRRAPKKQMAVAAAALLLFLNASFLFGAAPGLDEYNGGHFNEAYDRFQETLKEHPQTNAADKIEFDAGAAAYRMKDYGKAMQSFSQALLSPDLQLQSRSHYNLGNTLYQRGDLQKTPNEKLKDWTNALQHYEQTLKLEPESKEAKENYEFVKNKIEDLKKQQATPTPTPTPKPTPTPSPSPKPQDKNDQKKNDQQQSQDQDKDKQQQQDQSGQGEQKDQKQDQKKEDQQKSGQTPTPSPSPGKQDKEQGGAPTPSPNESSTGSSPTPSPGEKGQASPTPGEGDASPTPSPGEGEGEGNEGESPSPAPSASASPAKKPTGDVKSAAENESQEKGQDAAEEEMNDENQMSAQQAERLLRSMRDEEKHVQLDEHKAVRRVYKDW